VRIDARQGSLGSRRKNHWEAEPGTERPFTFHLASGVTVARRVAVHRPERDRFAWERAPRELPTATRTRLLGAVKSIDVVDTNTVKVAPHTITATTGCFHHGGRLRVHRVE